MLRLSCVVHGPIYGRFMGFYVNGFLSMFADASLPADVGWGSFVTHSFLPQTKPNGRLRRGYADAHISSLGYLWWSE